MNISLIVAMASNGVIGKNNQLPWHLPNDLRFFKSITTGKPIIMGRKCYESIGKPLPNRTNIIITKNENYQIDHAIIVNSFAKALDYCAGLPEICVIGGAQIYALALPFVNKMYITEVKTAIEGDIYFPYFDKKNWKEVNRVAHLADEKHQYDFDIVEYELID